MAATGTNRTMVFGLGIIGVLGVVALARYMFVGGTAIEDSDIPIVEIPPPQTPEEVERQTLQLGNQPPTGEQPQAPQPTEEEEQDPNRPRAPKPKEAPQERINSSPRA